MAKYTDEQKAAVLARVSEVGVREAAAEAGIPWQAVAKWNKAAAQELADAKTEDAVAIVEKADAENAQAAVEAVQEKKEDIMIAAAATELKVTKKADKASRKVKDKVEDAKLSIEAKAADVKDAVDATKIEVKKKTAKVSRKAKETKATAKEKVEKVKQPIRKARAAKMNLVFETSMGSQITPEEIAEKVPKGADAAYIKLEENKIYWVKGTETGAVDIW